MRLPAVFTAVYALLLTACAKPVPYGGPDRTGSMPVEIRESSGLAVSRHDPKIIWTHNDSGGEPVLYAIEPNGARRGNLRITGARNHDWEDLAAFTLQGRSYLLIADVGDNGGKRTDCVLYIVAEPEPSELSTSEETTAPVAWKIPVRYLDSPSDCESVAVDADAGLVYLLAKRTSPRALYTLPLQPPADGVVPAAMPVTRLPDTFFPQPSVGQSMLPIPTGRYRAQPTGMDFSSDGSMAVIVTYGDVLLFQREAGERWDKALGRPPLVLKPHSLSQAEGVAFSADSRMIYVSTEGEPSGIMRYKNPER